MLPQRAYSWSQRRAVSRAVAQRGPGAASQAWLRQRECRELCTMWSKKLRPAASEASQPPSVVRTARQAAQTRPAASPRHRTALSHAWNVPAEASAARAAGHILTRPPVWAARSPVFTGTAVLRPIGRRINHFPTHFAPAVPNPHSVQNADFPLEGTEGIRSSPDARILILSSRPPQLSHRRPATATVPHRCRQIQTTVDPVGGLACRRSAKCSCP